MTKSEIFKFIPRLSSQRGFAHHGWLKTYHSFSFASYYDSQHMNFGPLRVINEDHIDPAEGFDLHPHREVEVWTYVVSGALTHKDSMGNTETMRRGDIQYTSAGKGIFHAEQNLDKKNYAQILQIWATPAQRGLTPKYYTRHHDDKSKTGILKHIIQPVSAFEKGAKIPEQNGGQELIPIPNDINFFASILPTGQSLPHTFMKAQNATDVDTDRARYGYVHLAMTSGIHTPTTPAPADGARLKVTAEDGTEFELTEGDGLKIETKEGANIKFESTGKKDAEFVFFDLGKQ